MSFELIDRPLAWILVRWKGLVAGDGDQLATVATHEAEFQVELLDATETLDLFKLDHYSGEAVAPQDSLTIMKATLKGWRKIKAGGHPLPFTAENMERMSRVPNFGFAYSQAYLKANAGTVEIREGNSEGSPANGLAGEATEKTKTDEIEGTK